MFRLLLIILCFFTQNSLAESSCKIEDSTAGNLSVHVERGDFHLVSDKENYRQFTPLYVFGIGAYCKKLTLYKESGLIFIEIFAGGSGTKVLTTRSDLLIYRLGSKAPKLVKRLPISEETSSGVTSTVSVQIKYRYNSKSGALTLTDELTGEKQIVKLVN